MFTLNHPYFWSCFPVYKRKYATNGTPPGEHRQIETVRQPAWTLSKMIWGGIG
jgi:hypothetical protein